MKPLMRRMAVPCALQQRARGPLQLLCRAAQLEKIQRGERLMLVKVQLDIACLLPAAAVDAFPVRIGQRGPVFAEDIVTEAAGAAAGCQRAIQMRNHRLGLRAALAASEASRYSACGESVSSSRASTIATTLPSAYQRSSGSSRRMS